MFNKKLRNGCTHSIYKIPQILKMSQAEFER